MSSICPNVLFKAFLNALGNKSNGGFRVLLVHYGVCIRFVSYIGVTSYFLLLRAGLMLRVMFSSGFESCTVVKKKDLKMCLTFHNCNDKCAAVLIYIKTYIDIINAFSVTEKSNASMMEKNKKTKNKRINTRLTDP